MGVTALLLLVVLFSQFDVALRYHVWILSRNPSVIWDYAKESPGTVRERALRRFADGNRGRHAILNTYISKLAGLRTRNDLALGSQMESALPIVVWVGTTQFVDGPLLIQYYAQSVPTGARDGDALVDAFDVLRAHMRGPGNMSVSSNPMDQDSQDRLETLQRIIQEPGFVKARVESFPGALVTLREGHCLIEKYP